MVSNDDDPTIYFRCAIEAAGVVDIKDRGEEAKERLFPNAITLVETDRRIELSVDIDEDGDSFVEMTAHHACNPETGKGYHASLKMPLDRRAAERLRTAFDFLVQML